jgi:hypothetical protein
MPATGCFCVSGRGGAPPTLERHQPVRFLIPQTDPEMSLLNRLPGFERSPAGLEWALIRRLPRIALAGIAIPLLCLLALRLAATWANGDAAAKLAVTFEIVLAGVVVLYWTTVFTVALGCLIVMIAKGPAYVADAYPLPDADAPLP